MPTTSTGGGNVDALEGHTSYGYDLTTYTDALGHTTQYGYDELRRLVSTTDPAGKTT